MTKDQYNTCLAGIKYYKQQQFMKALEFCYFSEEEIENIINFFMYGVWKNQKLFEQRRLTGGYFESIYVETNKNITIEHKNEEEIK